MEARAAHAAYDAATGRVTLTCTTQMPHLMRTAIADLIGMPESDLRVIAPDVGGGFGQKMSLCAEYVLLVWLARKLKSSVAWTEDRRENLIACFHSRDQYVTLEAAFDQDAKLIALRADMRRQCRRLFLLSDHLRRRAADGDGGNARALRLPALPMPRARRSDQHLHHGAPIAACRGRSITFTLERLMDKAATAFGTRPGRHPPPQPDRQVPLHVGDGPGLRRGDL